VTEAPLEGAVRLVRRTRRLKTMTAPRWKAAPLLSSLISLAALAGFILLLPPKFRSQQTSST
jgi:hypothetical protein